jgi:2-polyprenyl-6-methoxyphenol hydroxylase-like FAD-dependent oxidoreductase
VSGAQVTAKADVVLVGAGIMSATLGALLRRLEPDWSITLVEQRSLEQRRHRAFRALRAVLHTAAAGRLDRRQQSGARQ